jgi:hypothetical protein
MTKKQEQNKKITKNINSLAIPPKNDMKILCCLSIVDVCLDDDCRSCVTSFCRIRNIIPTMNQ